MVLPFRFARLVAVLLPVVLAGALASSGSAALGHQLVASAAGTTSPAKVVPASDQSRSMQASAGLRIAGYSIPSGTPSRAASPRQAATSCTTVLCTFPLSVNPGLGAGKRFACPAIQHATGSITIVNRFALHQNVDAMRLTASGLPPNTDFDVFLVEHVPSDVGFGGFGFGWYQADLHSDSRGQASVIMVGIFDVETFIENPATPLAPIHTYNVGFWFNSPTQEAERCGNSTAPAAGPFNGEQNAGLLGMSTTGGPLQQIRG